MYRRPKFLELLIRIREEMAREADFDVDLFVERIRSGRFSEVHPKYTLSDKEGPPEGHTRKPRRPGKK